MDEATLRALEEAGECAGAGVAAVFFVGEYLRDAFLDIAPLVKEEFLVGELECADVIL